jgi:hypothetical protein
MVKLFKIMKRFYSVRDFPLISLATHEKPGCNESCIDNLITNDVEGIIAAGVLRDRISHLKYKQYYDYCHSNVDNFLDKLEYSV